MKAAMNSRRALAMWCALWVATLGPGTGHASPTEARGGIQGEGAPPVVASARADRWSTTQATAVPPPDPDPLDVRWSPLGTVKWVALGVALVTLAGGITLLALDGVNVPCGSPDGVLCPERYTTVTPGAILTAAGASVAVAVGSISSRSASLRAN